MTTLTNEVALPAAYQHCTWRPYTRDDMAALSDLLYADEVSIGITNYRMSVADMLAEYFDGHYNVETSTRLLITPAGQVIARVEVYDQGEPPVRNSMGITIAPEHVGHGLEEVCMGWALRRAREAVARCPAEARVVVQSWVPQQHAHKKAMFEAAGFRVVRHFFRMKIDMAAAPSVPPLAEGYSLRTMRMPDDVEAYMRARVDAWRDHWGYVEQPFEKAVEQFVSWVENDPKWTPDRVYLIIHDASGEVAAFCNTRIEEWGDPTVAHVATLATRRAHRKRGLANFLLRHTFRTYYDLGKPSVTLYVDAASLTGALKLYEDAGMHADQVETTYEVELRGGVDLTTH